MKRCCRFCTSALILLAGGCGFGPDAADTAAFTVRDSAGVRIAVNGEAAVDSAPPLSLVEELRIGSVSGRPEEEFGLIRDIAVDEDGRLWVLDSRLRVVRAFAPDGSFLLEFGREGGGPGEFDFEQLDFAVGDDTVLVVDRSRAHVFDTDGAFLDAVAQEVTGNQLIPVLARGRDGWIVGVPQRRRAGDGAGVVQDTLRLRPLDAATGQAGAPIVEIPGRRTYRDADGRGTSPWISPEPSAAVRPNGEIYVTDGDAYRIRVLSAEGQPLREIRAAVPRIELTASAADEAAARLTRYYDSVGISREVGDADRARAALGHPEARPVPGRLLVAPGGRVLLERRDLEPDPHPLARQNPVAWDLIDPEGRVIGRLLVEVEVNLRVLGDQAVWAIVRDELNVPYVVRYRIE